MSSSSKTGNSSTPRIQISLSKDQRKNMAAAAAASTPAKASDVTANASAYPQKTIDSVMAANPGLYKSVRKALKNQTLNFKINVECKLVWRDSEVKANPVFFGYIQFLLFLFRDKLRFLTPSFRCYITRSNTSKLAITDKPNIHTN